MNSEDLVRLASSAAETDGRVGRRAIAAMRLPCRAACRDHGRAAPALSQHMLRVEQALRRHLTPGGAVAFQTLVAEIGARQAAPIQIPEDRVPYWLLGPQPFAGFRSTPELPARAGVVVIGAGLTGASAAYHLAMQAKQGLSVVVLEAGDPATQASGRNGGNFELMPENFLGAYEGLPRERAKWLARTRRGLEGEALRVAAERQARVILRFCIRNTRRLMSIASRERIACDLSPAGWLRIADTAAEERALAEEVRLAAALGGKVALWPRDRIRRRMGIPARFAGRMALGNGNYHPFKFVNGLLASAVRCGVMLYTGTPVLRLGTARDGGPVVETPFGNIAARSVILATNAFTEALLPELFRIRYYQSQIMTLEHVCDTLGGMTVTEKKGDLYYNFPLGRKYADANGAARGMLLVGGGLDRPGRNPAELRRSAGVLELVKKQTDERFPSTRGQPPSRLWTGPMAFSSDRLPAIGFLHAKGRPSGLIVAAGFNGYGGSYCVEAGRTAARMAIGDHVVPGVPADVFSPDRFLDPAARRS